MKTPLACPFRVRETRRRLSRSALLFATWFAPVAFGQFSVKQLDYYNNGSLAVANSEWGELTVNYAPGSGYQYLNVVIDPGTSSERWAVQNLAMLPSAVVGGSPYSTTVQFDLGVTRGTDVSSLNIAYSFSAAPDATPTALVNGTIGVGNSQGITNTGVPSGLAALNAGGIAPPNWAGGLGIGDVTWHQGMPNVVQERNFCGPGAAANSLHWLNAQNNLGLAQTLGQTQGELAGNMGNNNSGNWDDTEVQGKLQYILEHQLGLEVHYVGGEKLPTVGNYTEPNGNGVVRNDGAVTWDWLVNEMKKGQDIEVMTATHWVVVEGTFSIGDNHFFMYRDDPYQHGGATTAGEAQDIANRHTLSYFNGGWGNIGNGNEKILAMVAESPTAVPEPASFGLAGATTLVALAWLSRWKRRGIVALQ